MENTLPLHALGMGAVRPPPAVVCPLLKKSKCNPCLESLDSSQLFVAVAPLKKNPENLLPPTLRGFLFLDGKIAHAFEG